MGLQTLRTDVIGAFLTFAIYFSQAHFTCLQSSTYAGRITCQRRNPYCQIVDDHRLDGQERQEILLAHNRIRREAAKGFLRRYGLPAAANMKKLEWDDDLANNAQAHVEVTCKLKHDHPNQRTTGSYSDVGQNIYITEVWNQKLEPDTWGVVVEELWGHEEAAKLHTNSFGRRLTLQKHDLKSIGHLTQLLWAETEKVGCGKIVFEGTNGATSDLRTCDYGEGGNVIGGKMYIEGVACSACPDSHPYCDDGLCSRIPGYGPTHYSYTQSTDQSYAPSYQPAIQPRRTSFWLAAPARRFYAATNTAHYYTNSRNSLTRYNPYVQRHQLPQYDQNTHIYQGYTVLQRKRRRTISSDRGQRRTSIL